MKPRIKICCISSRAEALMAISYGASAIGLVGHMPSGPGVIEDKLIHSISQTIPPPIATFLLTSETQAKDIIRHHQRTQTNTIQLVDEVTEKTYAEIRKALPVVKLVQVIHVIDEFSIEKALIASEFADALLLDSGNPKLKIKTLGGTGKIHDWKLSRKIVEQSRVPVFLAGGLNPGNTRQAVETVQPFGVDVCSGVRTNGKLDERKLEEFMILP